MIRRKTQNCALVVNLLGRKEEPASSIEIQTGRADLSAVKCRSLRMTANLMTTEEQKLADRAKCFRQMLTKYVRKRAVEPYSPLALQFFSSRGINPDLARGFLLFEFDNSFVEAVAKLERCEFFDTRQHCGGLCSKQLIIDARIVLLSETGVENPFENRLTIPVFNADYTECWCLTARALAKDVQPKYYTSRNPASSIHMKGGVFGYSRPDEPAVVFEGPTDAIAATALGIPNALALMGLLVEETQILDLICRKPSKILVCLDGDRAAEERTEDVVNSLRRVGVPVRVVKPATRFDIGDELRDYGSESPTAKVILSLLSA
jgi:DNA primase